jgi:glutaminyl-peptide cyclotransferase
VLLDLIGSKNARFACSMPNTCGLNKRLRQIENTLLAGSSLRNIDGGPASVFLNTFRNSGVSDDHLPFMIRNVSVLHLIPISFPSTWHTNQDNEKHLNQDAILNFNRIMRVFVIDYLRTCADNPKSKGCSFK